MLLVHPFVSPGRPLQPAPRSRPAGRPRYPAAMAGTAPVVVVGAGAAGLAAAVHLRAAGVDAVVLEARDRIGGRLLSVPAGAGRRLDLGATWFWDGEADVGALAAGAGLEVFDQHRTGDLMFQPGPRVERVRGNPLDVPSRRIASGMQSLAEALQARLPDAAVRLGEPVRAIAAEADGLVVETPRGAWRAPHVVLALPPALAVHAIAFDPPLDPELAALAAATPVWMGAFLKAVARYPEPFWRARGLAGAAFSHTGPLREVHDMSGPEGAPAALFGFAPLAPGAPTPGADAIRAQLGALFGAEAAEPLEFLLADWRAEPCTTPPGADRLGRYDTYGDPRYRAPAMGGRLHWASTETAQDAPGHVQGALSAGARAAAAAIAGP